MAVLVAWPLWRYQSDRILFERRAILAAVATPTGRLWRWFWRGRITSVLQVFVALAFAISLLCLMSALRPLHWSILVADAIVLAFIIRPVRRMLSSQIKEGYLGLVARRWPLTAINVVLLVAAFVVLEFYFIERPDTRGLSWAVVVEGAFENARNGAVCPAAGLLLGAVCAVDQLSWHVAMGLLPKLPSMPARAMAWVVFLAWTGFGAFLFTRCMLGVIALLDRFGAGEAGADDKLSRAFLYTILVLAVPYLYATIKLAEWEPTLPSLPPSLPTVERDPCKAYQFSTAELIAGASEDVQQARTEAYSVVDQRIDAALNEAFGAAEQGVAHYLDWYYSLVGDYTRLGAVVTGDVGQLMNDQLAKHIFDDTNAIGILETESTALEGESMNRMESAAAAVGLQIRDAVKQSPCPVPSFDPSRLMHLERDRMRAAVSTTAAGAVTAKFLLTKPATAVAAKLAAKGTVKAASKVMAKAAAKKGVSVIAAAGTATAICSPGGPAAIVCGIVAGVITWFTVDKVILEIDEAVNRDDMREELLAGLREQREAAGNELKALHRGLVDAYVAEINTQVGKTFNPSRDGI